MDSILISSRKCTNYKLKNLEYARSSLTKLEHDALAIKAPGRRAEVQGDLNGKRELLEALLDRLEDLRQVGTELHG